MMHFLNLNEKIWPCNMHGAFVLAQQNATERVLFHHSPRRTAKCVGLEGKACPTAKTAPHAAAAGHQQPLPCASGCHYCT